MKGGKCHMVTAVIWCTFAALEKVSVVTQIWWVHMEKKAVFMNCTSGLPAVTIHNHFLDMMGSYSWTVACAVTSHPNKTPNYTKWCIYLFRRCEANRLTCWLSGVSLCSCNNVNKILWSRVINILFNLENAAFQQQQQQFTVAEWFL